MVREPREARIDFQRIVQAVPYALVIANGEGRIIFANARAETMFGYAKAEIRHQPLTVLVAPCCQAALDDVMAHCLAYSPLPPSSTIAWYGRCKDGSEFPMELSLSPVDAPAGTLLVGMLCNITAQKQTEEALRQQALLIELSYEPILVWGLDHGIVLWNRGCEQLYGFTAAEALGQSSHALLATVFPESLALFQTALTRDRKWSGELRHTTRDGRQVIVESRHQLVEANGRLLVLETNRDITLRKQTEDALRRVHNELEQRVQERTAALTQSNAALRAEIQARQRVEKERQLLLGRLVTIQEEERRRLSRELHDQLGQELHALMLGLKSLEVQAQNSPTMAAHIAQLQALTAHIGQEMHHLAWALRPPDLDVDGVDTVLRHHVEEWSQRSDILVEFHSRGFTGQRLPFHLETALYRIVQEALTNVLKHARAQRISMLLERRRDYVLAIIEDDGRGFHAEAQSNTRLHPGRLGILGMQERAALVEGTVAIESTPEVGTTVFVRLPIPSACDEQPGATSPTAGEEGAP